MMSDNTEILFKRVLENKCPICNKPIAKEAEVVKHNNAKLNVCRIHIKFKRKK